MANRYVLLKNDGEGPKPCAFYSSSLGCRNGAECKFLHGDQPTAASTTALQPKQPPEQTPQPKVDISPAPQLIPREDHPTDSSSKTSLMTPMPTKKPRKKARRKQESVDTPVATSVTSTLTSPQSQPNGKPLKPTVPTTADASLAISEDKERASREKALRKAVAAAARAQAKAAEAAKALEEAQAKAGVAGTSVAVDTPKPGDLAVAGSKSKAFQTPAANIPSERMQLAKTGGEKVINGQGNAVRKATTSDQILNSGAPVTDELPGLESEASSKKKKKRKKKDMQAPDTAAFPAGDANGMNTPAAPAAAAPAATASAPPTSGGAAAGEKVCSYFTKKKGCKSGELCTFLHDEKRHQGHGVAKGSAATPPNETKVAKSPQASSNSAPRTQPSRVEPNGRGGEQAVKKRKTKSISRSVAPVADQPVAPVEARADSGSSASSAVALVPATSPSPVPVSSPVQGTRARDGDDRSKRKRSRSKASNGSGDGFLDGLPVSPFVQAPTKPSSQAARQVKNRPPAQAAAAPAAPPEIPHLKADPWEALVAETQAHPRFKSDYRFETDSSWITASPCGERCADLPQVVAIDCEMCETEDPVSRSRNGKDLVRISVVDAGSRRAILDTLVRPSNPVVSWRTSIHGVYPKHLDGVAFTLRHAQAAMSRICCKRTIIIGHALHGDLQSIKMSHDRVIDTSYIYKREGAPEGTPSLRDVVKAMLKVDFQEGVHDSVLDAQVQIPGMRRENGFNKE